jgi:hypothetical protein
MSVVNRAFLGYMTVRYVYILHTYSYLIIRHVHSPPTLLPSSRIAVVWLQRTMQHSLWIFEPFSSSFFFPWLDWRWHVEFNMCNIFIVLQFMCTCTWWERSCTDRCYSTILEKCKLCLFWEQKTNGNPCYFLVGVCVFVWFLTLMSRMPGCLRLP